MGNDLVTPLYCLACEHPLIPRPHRAPDHAEPAWMCGNLEGECILSGVCLSCQKLLAWFREQDDALGDA